VIPSAPSSKSTCVDIADITTLQQNTISGKKLSDIQSKKDGLKAM
jgi:hypothetical protein